MKKYLLFSGDQYYPGGGWEDFIGDFDTVDEAETRVKDENDDWYQIVDTAAMLIIE